MKRPIIIKNVITSLLLCTLTLSITPVFFVHTLFAKHTDNTTDTQSTGYHLTEGGFNCKCDDFVAEAQFLNDAEYIPLKIIKYFSVFNGSHSYHFYSQHHFYSELRGPPVLV